MSPLFATIRGVHLTAVVSANVENAAILADKAQWVSIARCENGIDRDGDAIPMLINLTLLT